MRDERHEELDAAIERAGQEAGAPRAEIEQVKKKAHMIDDVLSGGAPLPDAGSPTPCDDMAEGDARGESPRGRGGYSDGAGGDEYGDRNESRR